jgi:hypothetical protein
MNIPWKAVVLISSERQDKSVHLVSYSRFRNWRWRQPVVFAMAALFALLQLEASDHSDAPVSNGTIRQDANLTDLHAFADGTNLVIALCSNPAIPKSAASYLFPSDVTFDINIDNRCTVDPEDPNGMGGTILEPDKIQEQICFRIRFDDAGNPRLQTFKHREPKYSGPMVVNFFAGLRDDPFIRGPRQGRNVAAIVLQIPLNAVINEQSTLLIWATSKVDEFDGPFQDLVGRSLRSMMPENNAMNEMPVAHQARAMGVAPDVMIFDTARPAAFPNGRALTDDVIDLVGDARLLANDYPFPSTNDVPFLNEFPYLAPPHPPQ